MTDGKSLKIKRGTYTFCFLAFCIIDWVKCTLNGRLQMTATNLSGVVLAVIIFSSYKIRDFMKVRYLVWGLLCMMLIPVGCIYMMGISPYKGQIISAAFNIVVYGLIYIRLLSDGTFINQRKKIRLWGLTLWGMMLILMFASVNENIWPAWYAMIFLAYYIVQFDCDDEIIIYQAAVDGVILGFFVIQGLALLFRPYDIARYNGLYANPNINALFYLMVYSAFLCKWFGLKKRGERQWLRFVCVLFAGAMYAFCVFTGSKASVLAMLIVTIPFIWLSLSYKKNKVLSFIKYWIVLGAIGIVSIPIVYFAIRYMPTIHLHPIYFEGEYSEEKILPGDSNYSEKYVTFDEAMQENLGRVFYMIPQSSFFSELGFAMKVHAAEIVESEEAQEQEFVFSYMDTMMGIDPLRLRYEIAKYYFLRLNLCGHTNDYEPAPISECFTSTHAHNVFIQMAFLYGIPAGLLFLLFIASFIPGCIQLAKRGEDEKACVIACFILAFVVFGFFEIDWMCGQLPFGMVFILFRDVIRKT